MSPYGVTSSKQIYPKVDHHVCMHGQHCEMQGTVYAHVSLAVDGDAEIEKVRSRYVVGMYKCISDTFGSGKLVGLEIAHSGSRTT